MPLLYAIFSVLSLATSFTIPSLLWRQCLMVPCFVFGYTRTQALTQSNIFKRKILSLASTMPYLYAPWVRWALSMKRLSKITYTVSILDIFQGAWIDFDTLETLKIKGVSKISTTLRILESIIWNTKVAKQISPWLNELLSELMVLSTSNYNSILKFTKVKILWLARMHLCSMKLRPYCFHLFSQCLRLGITPWKLNSLLGRLKS